MMGNGIYISNVIGSYFGCNVYTGDDTEEISLCLVC